MQKTRDNQSGRTNTSTGCRALDELLDQAPPQVLAGMYVASKLAYSCGEWNGLMAGVLADRVMPLREQFPGDGGDEPDEVLVPRWLAFADAFDAGTAVEQ